MAYERKPELCNRLDAHFATLKSQPTGCTMKRRLAGWRMYAAVTGSAMAMASSASASIIYGHGPVGTTPIPNI